MGLTGDLGWGKPEGNFGSEEKVAVVYKVAKGYYSAGPLIRGTLWPGEVHEKGGGR
jgi:hypothetical protein